ncbi:hypothetical protein GDO81_009763 [Engystomops pustulosus]|uniref:Uncharacterized protein n=1 Tax=Engystomops pustulosus TaxID=76066 RepID=A0AAV7BU01_ENGPU|nr:hypothetical protein GDO81_009763 [Engystomops pustulosus]
MEKEVEDLPQDFQTVGLCYRLSGQSERRVTTIVFIVTCREPLHTIHRCTSTDWVVMDHRPDWIGGSDEPAKAVIASNTLSKMARRSRQVQEEVTKIKQRVDRMILNFERSCGILGCRQGAHVEIMENMDELESILQDQRRKYQQKLTVFIVGFQETCGQRKQLLTQLQEFFSIYSNMNEVERDQYRGQPALDLDGIAIQVTGAVRSAEAAMSRLTELHNVVMSHLSQVVSAGAQAKRKPMDDRGRKTMEKLLAQARQHIGQLTDKLVQAQEELTMKDQQMKELQKLNEMRALEICHVKGQMETTKKNLQVLQQETAMQHSLLEAEITKQGRQLERLTSQKSAEAEHLTNASTQWEVQDCMFTFNEDDSTGTDVEGNAVEESVQAVEEIHLTANNNEHNNIQDFSMELIPEDIDHHLMDMSKPEFPGPSFSVYGENISSTCLIPVAYKDSLEKILPNVEEYSSPSHVTDNNKSCMTPPPIIQDNAIYDDSQISSGEIMDGSSEPFPFIDNGSDTIPNYEVDQENFDKSSSERYHSPDDGAHSFQANNCEINHLSPNVISFIPDEHTKPRTDLPNIYTHLKDSVFALKFESDENTSRCPPVVNIMVTPSSDNTHATSVPKSNMDDNESDKKIQQFASFSIIQLTTDPNTSTSELSNSIHSLTEPNSLTNKESNIEISANEMKSSSHTDPIHKSSQPHSGNETGPTYNKKHMESERVETSNNSDHHRELRSVSERLHKCMKEIRNMLITEGFHCIANELVEEIQDEHEESLSTNLTQLENFPTVLRSLIINITRKSTENKGLTEEHSPILRKEEDTNIKDSFFPVKHIGDESQNCDGLPMKARFSNDLGHTSSVIFTRSDEEHNRRELQWASCQGRIPIHKYQDTTRMMSKYRILCQERLHCLLWGYVQYISWNKAETLLRSQCLSRPQITPVLNKLQKQKDQAFLQWRDKILQSREKRLHLSENLCQTLQKLHAETGIFLIRPQISWPGTRSSMLETRKESNTNNSTVQCSCFNQCSCQDLQNSIMCRGISRGHVTKKWKYMHTHTELRPLVVTPKLLEMDIHRCFCKECW